MHTRSEMLDLVVVDGEAKGITVRNLVTGEITSLNNLTFFFIYLVQSQYFIINKQNLLFE